jgi:hypothetical protein
MSGIMTEMKMFFADQQLGFRTIVSAVADVLSICDTRAPKQIASHFMMEKKKEMEVWKRNVVLSKGQGFLRNIVYDPGL